MLFGVESVFAPGALSAIFARLRCSGRGRGRVVGEERRGNSTDLTAMVASKFQITIHAGGKKVLHVVSNNADTPVWKVQLANLMAAAQVDTKRCRGLDIKAGSDKGPSLFQIDFRARQLEVVNVDDEEELQERVEVARRPLLRNGLKTNRNNVFVAMFLQKGAAIRMSI